jgi:hypothetical protein
MLLIFPARLSEQNWSSEIIIQTTDAMKIKATILSIYCDYSLLKKDDGFNF